MAVPPTIPTSFVPHPGSSLGQPHSGHDITGAFGFFAYFVLGFVVLSAFGVFGYDQFLASRETTKNAELSKAQTELDPHTVSNVVRLRDRLSYGDSLLNAHVAPSNLFRLFENILPRTVRFERVRLVFDTQGKATLTAEGTAKTFNALAAASDALGKDGRIRNAIFSGVSVANDNTVDFTLSALIDRDLFAFKPAETSSVSSATTTTP